MSARRFADLAELAAGVGQPLGTSAWREITQARVDRFAEATDDAQWIHVDPVRAADGPYGGTIAHGFLIMSLLPRLTDEVFTVDGVVMVVNAGAERLAFPSPVLVGERIRLSATLAEFGWRARGTAEIAVDATVEIDGRSARACAALLRLVMRPASRARTVVTS